MATQLPASILNRRKSVTGVSFAPDTTSTKTAQARGVALGPSDKENTSSPRPAASKKRKGRVSFAGTDELLLYDIDDIAKGLCARPPPTKKNKPAATPTKRRSSVTPLEQAPKEEEEHALQTIPAISEEVAIEPQNNAVNDEGPKNLAFEASPAEQDAEEFDMDIITPEVTIQDILLAKNPDDSTGDKNLSFIEDVLAPDLSQSAVGSWKAEIDDELSAIYNKPKSKTATIAEEDLEGTPIQSPIFTPVKDTSASEKGELNLSTTSTRWTELMGGRRDSLSLPSMARRDSFSLLSTKHLLSGSSKALPVTEPIAPQASKSRRESLQMEMTNSDLGAIIAEEVDPEETIRIRRTSLAMDITHTDLGSILQGENNVQDMEEEEAPQTITIVSRSRRNSIMEMTFADFGRIEPDAASEAPEALTQRMDMTHTDLGAILEEESTTTTTIDLRQTATLKRRKSLAMEETISNFGAILEADIPITDVSQASTFPDANTQSLNKSVLETAEERAAKPASNLLSKLGLGVTAPQAASEALIQATLPASTKAQSRRQSLAMEMTVTNFGEILRDETTHFNGISEQESSEVTTKTLTIGAGKRAASRRQSLAMDMTVADFGEILNDESAAAPQDDVELSMELEDGDDVCTPEVTSAFLNSAAEEVEMEMEMTTNIPVVIETESLSNPDISQEVAQAQPLPVEEAVSVPAESQEVAAKENIGETVAKVVAEPVNDVPAVEEPVVQVEEPIVVEPQQQEMSLRVDESMQVDNVDDVLFSDVVSITSSFPNLSMSLTSRNAFKTAVESIQAHPISAPSTQTGILFMKEIHSAQNDQSAPSAPAPSVDAPTIELPEVEDPAIPSSHVVSEPISVEEAEPMQENQSGDDQNMQVEEAPVERTATSFGIQLPPLPTEDEVSGKNWQELDEILNQDTKKLVAKRKTPPSALDISQMLNNLAPGSPLASTSALEDAPLLKAMHSAIQVAVSREPVSAPSDAPASLNVSIADMDISSASYGEGESDEMEESNTARLEKAQKEFENHVMQQLRTPGVRKSLLSASSMTPATTGRHSLNSSRMSLTSGTTTGRYAVTSSLLSASLSRFMSQYGVNFLDGMASRRQSIGVRVTEPRTEYDRMMSVLRSEPELNLQKRVFSDLSEMIGDCERRLRELEDACLEQCSTKSGVYNFFAEAITTHHADIRKDLSKLKQFVTTDAKVLLNKEIIGHKFELLLRQSLQETLDNAQTYLSQLEEQQAATITTKISMAKVASAGLSSSEQAPTTATSMELTTTERITEEHVNAAKNNFCNVSSLDDLLAQLHGWLLLESSPQRRVIDIQNAAEVELDVSPESNLVKAVNVSCVMGAKTQEEDDRRVLFECLLGQLPIQEWSSGKQVEEVAREANVRIGRILDLLSELRTLGQQYLIKSIKPMENNKAILADIVFSNHITGARFSAKFALSANYPYEDATLVIHSIDNSFGLVNAQDIATAVEEEADKCTWKLMTRICKRLYRMYSV